MTKSNFMVVTYDSGDDIDVLARKIAELLKARKFEVGDFARALPSGEYVKISDTGFDGEYLVKSIFNGEESFLFDDKLEKLSEEESTEAKEVERWTSIGRKVGEYRVGDIVKYIGDGELAVVTDIATSKSMQILVKRLGYCLESISVLTLITPVEARFDRYADK